MVCEACLRPPERPAEVVARRATRAMPSSLYSADYLIDTDHGVIVDVEATRAIR